MSSRRCCISGRCLGCDPCYTWSLVSVGVHQSVPTQPSCIASAPFWTRLRVLVQCRHNGAQSCLLHSNFRLLSLNMMLVNKISFDLTAVGPPNGRGPVMPMPWIYNAITISSSCDVQLPTGRKGGATTAIPDVVCWTWNVLLVERLCPLDWLNALNNHPYTTHPILSVSTMLLWWRPTTVHIGDTLRSLCCSFVSATLFTCTVLQHSGTYCYLSKVGTGRGSIPRSGKTQNERGPQLEPPIFRTQTMLLQETIHITDIIFKG